MTIIYWVYLTTGLFIYFIYLSFHNYRAFIFSQHISKICDPNNRTYCYIKVFFRCHMLPDHKVVKSVKELSLRFQWPFLSPSLAFLLYFFLGKRGRKLKELFSTLGAFRRSRRFCLGTKRGLGGFVRVLFVEVELSKSGCFLSL